MRLPRMLLGLVFLLVLMLPAGASAQGSCPNEGLRETQGSAFLPDCRAYELVSPADKNGGDVLSAPLRTRASTSGDAVGFTSFAGFGDVKGTNIAVEYVAQRGPDGWGIHAITPQQEPYSVFIPTPGNQASFDELSGDLSQGVVYAPHPLTSGGADVENVAKVPNFYRRSDILAGPPGSYQLVSASVNPLAPFFAFESSMYLAGTSEDFKHILFESKNDLTPEATGEEWKLYEWEDGTLRLAGILPEGGAAERSQAGRGARSFAYTESMVARDGSRVFFTIPSSEEPGVAAATEDGAIYLRENHTRTIQLNVNERTQPPGADPNGPQSAELWYATPDGSQVFFTTAEDLTNEDNNGIGPDISKKDVDLYRYDVNAPTGHHLTLLSHDPEGKADGGVKEVLGTTPNGSYVYFRDEQGGLPPAVYVWHNGTVRLVGNEETFPSDLDERGSWARHATVTLDVVGSSVRVTAGGALVYETDSPQTSYDTTEPANRHCSYDIFTTPPSSHCAEVYVYEPAANRVVCVSCNPSGASPTGDAVFNLQADIGAGGTVIDQQLSHVITNDGAHIFFDTQDSLVPQDTNGHWDVYEFDVATGGVHLISTGQAASDSIFLDASPDGSNVFFTTRQRLLSADIDGSVDLYDARVGGGIAGQDQSAAAGCVGDTCQGSPGSPPAAPVSPASLALSGAGNLPPAVGGIAKKAKHVVKKKPKKKVHGKHRKAKRARRSGKSASRRLGR